MRKEMRWSGPAVVALVIALFAGCNGRTSTELAEMRTGSSLHGLICCTGAGQFLGRVEVQLESEKIDSLAPGQEFGFSMGHVEPPGVLDFAWDGPFIADNRENGNVFGEQLPFDPDLDVGGFARATQALYVNAHACGFERASFDVTVFVFERIAGQVSVLEMQPQHVDIVFAPASENGDDCDAPPPPAPLIVFARSLPGEDSEIWTTDTAGHASQLTDNADEDQDPAWSPDRTKIAYVSNGDSFLYPEVFLMDAATRDTERATRFADNFLSAGDPAWSPDGRKIAVTVGAPGAADTDIWVVDLDRPLAFDRAFQLTAGSRIRPVPLLVPGRDADRVHPRRHGVRRAGRPVVEPGPAPPQPLRERGGLGALRRGRDLRAVRRRVHHVPDLGGGRQRQRRP